MPLEEVYEVLQVEPKQGLPSTEVRSRTSEYGANTIPKIRGPFWKVYIAPILNWLITI